MALTHRQRLMLRCARIMARLIGGRDGVEGFDRSWARWQTLTPEQRDREYRETLQKAIELGPDGKGE